MRGGKVRRSSKGTDRGGKGIGVRGVHTVESIGSD